MPPQLYCMFWSRFDNSKRIAESLSAVPGHLFQHGRVVGTTLCLLLPPHELRINSWVTRLSSPFSLTLPLGECRTKDRGAPPVTESQETCWCHPYLSIEVTLCTQTLRRRLALILSRPSGTTEMVDTINLSAQRHILSMTEPPLWNRERHCWNNMMRPSDSVAW